MTADINLALRFVGFCGALWAVALVLILSAGPLGLSGSLNIVVVLATLVPFFVVRFFAAPYLLVHPGKPKLAEMMPFMLFGFVGVSGLAFVFEAVVITKFLGQSESVGLGQVLTQPLTSRYNMSTLFGLSFWAATSAICAISVGLRFVSAVHLRHRWAKPTD
ncbi:MAG: hypothetical protein AAF386_02520 [Pseudomonadota bacterium]